MAHRYCWTTKSMSALKKRLMDSGYEVEHQSNDIAVGSKLPIRFGDLNAKSDNLYCAFFPNKAFLVGESKELTVKDQELLQLFQSEYKRFSSRSQLAFLGAGITAFIYLFFAFG